MFVKICGITRMTDARHAARQGATALGFVFWPSSPRYVTPERAAEIIADLPSGLMSVGVFVNESVERIRTVAAQTGIAVVQLHGDEPPGYGELLGRPVLRSVNLDEVDRVGAAWPDATLLLDAADPLRRGGTGVPVDWTRAAAVAKGRRIILAGGLRPSNVAAAIAMVRPFGVDVSSGVEASPGVKSFEKLAKFVTNARAAFAEGGARDDR